MTAAVALRPVVRSFVSEMNALLTERWPSGDFIAPAFAADFVDYVRARDPELLRGYLDEVAPAIFAHLISLQSERERGAARRSSVTRSFSEDEASPRRSLFETNYVIDEHFTRRPLGQMTGSDHRFVAQVYKRDGNGLLLLAKFHEAVARKIGAKQTQIMGEAKYQALYRSIVGAQA